MLLHIGAADRELVRRSEIVECRIPHWAGIALIVQQEASIAGRNLKWLRPGIELVGLDDPHHASHGEVIVMQGDRIVGIGLELSQRRASRLHILA